MLDAYCLLRSAINPDGTRQPWSLYQWMPGVTNRQAHRFAREDRRLAPTDLIAVRKAGTTAPRPSVGQCCSLVDQFTPPYPISC
jgi:hypothetical protein